jgi:hypothetical protein
MRSVKTLFLCTALGLLAACDSDRPGKQSDNRGSEIIGNYSVSWSIARSKSEPLSAAPVFFSFNHARGSLPPEIPHAAWQKEADRLKTTVRDLKFLSGYPYATIYVSKDGYARQCNMQDVKKGLCSFYKPKPLKLSVKTRAKLAQQALEASSKCRWLGFDEGYNRLKSHWAGAIDTTLWVKADCS